MALPQPVYDYGVISNQDIVMRDGIRLRHDMYFPVKDDKLLDEKFGTILLRQMYDKTKTDFMLDPRYFARRGFAVIFQDVRGRHKSEGIYYHGITEVDDGYDTVEWIAKQHWSNGMVGMTGISYMGAVQAAAAIGNPPHLTAIFHVQSPWSYYHDHYRRGGETLLYIVSNGFNVGTFALEAESDPAIKKAMEAAQERPRDWLKRWPLKKGLNPLSQTPSTEAWILDPLDHPNYDEFWKKVPLWQPMEYVKEYADIYSYYVGGWWDPYREDLFFSGLRPFKKKPIKLLVGPWLHAQFGRTMGDVDFGEDAALTFEQYNELQLSWFTHTLGHGNTGIMNEPPVKIFVMGGGDGTKTTVAERGRDARLGGPEPGKLNHGGRWRFENEWPIARTKYTPYYLHRNSLLDTEKSTEKDSSVTYSFDPDNPVPTIGTNYFFNELLPKTSTTERIARKFVPYGPHDQREMPGYFGCTSDLPLASRHDVNVFQTPRLDQDIEITGPIVVRLWASSSAIDTDFTAKLVDVHPSNIDYPEGYAMNLTSSLIRACYRNGFEKREMVKPGEFYEFRIELPATCNLFTKGHRIRLDISSSNYPESDVNPNTGEIHKGGGGGKVIVADNTIYHEAGHSSCVILPIIAS